MMYYVKCRYCDGFGWNSVTLDCGCCGDKEDCVNCDGVGYVKTEDDPYEEGYDAGYAQAREDFRETGFVKGAHKSIRQRDLIDKYGTDNPHELIAIAGKMYDADRHDEDSIYFDDSYVGPSERELNGGCNRCGGWDDCYCEV